MSFSRATVFIADDEAFLFPLSRASSLPCSANEWPGSRAIVYSCAAHKWIIARLVRALTSMTITFAFRSPWRPGDAQGRFSLSLSLAYPRAPLFRSAFRPVESSRIQQFAGNVWHLHSAQCRSASIVRYRVASTLGILRAFPAEPIRKSGSAQNARTNFCVYHRAH